VNTTVGGGLDDGHEPSAVADGRQPFAFEDFGAGRSSRPFLKGVGSGALASPKLGVPEPVYVRISLTRGRGTAVRESSYMIGYSATG
jgi:hypothetical protein